MFLTCCGKYIKIKDVTTTEIRTKKKSKLRNTGRLHPCETKPHVNVSRWDAKRRSDAVKQKTRSF
jgi:hypothetical protein